jgi:acyl carrier protein
MERIEVVKKAVFEAIDEVNEMLSKEYQLQKSLNTVLLGESSSLDSVALVSFIVAAEEHINTELGVSISLVDEMADIEGPLRTVGTFIDYVANL